MTRAGAEAERAERAVALLQDCVRTELQVAADAQSAVAWAREHENSLR